MLPIAKIILGYICIQLKTRKHKVGWVSSWRECAFGLAHIPNYWSSSCQSISVYWNDPPLEPLSAVLSAGTVKACFCRHWRPKKSPNNLHKPQLISKKHMNRQTIHTLKYHGAMGCDSCVGAVALQIGIVPNQPFWNLIQIRGNIRLVTPYPEACNFSLCYVPEAYLNRLSGWSTEPCSVHSSYSWCPRSAQPETTKHDRHQSSNTFRWFIPSPVKRKTIFSQDWTGFIALKYQAKGLYCTRILNDWTR